MSNSSHKYKLCRNDTIVIDNNTLYRIQALKSFSDVAEGDFGGYVQSYDNLSQTDNCWIYENAKVIDRAAIYDNAKVHHEAVIKDDAQIFQDAYIGCSAIISDFAIVTDKTTVNCNVKIKNNAKIQDMAIVMDKAVIKGNAIINGNAIICGNAIVSNRSVITGNAVIYGEVNIENTTDVLVIGPIGSRERYTTFIKQPDNIYVRCGCFFDNIDNFAKEVTRRHETNNHAINYMSAIDFVKIYFNNTGEE